MIMYIHQRNGVKYFEVPLQQSLIDIVCIRVQYGSTIFTDGNRAYDTLEEYRFLYKSVNHSQKGYANDTIHVNNCECRSNCTNYG
jgi:transposase-like protein